MALKLEWINIEIDNILSLFKKNEKLFIAKYKR
jgi:hypothetical protein